MKNKMFLAAIFLVIIALAFGGCQLAREDVEPGRLIGVFITNESLDLLDIDGYIDDNIGMLSPGGEVVLNGNNEKYKGRLYATKKERVETDSDGKTETSYEYVFENVEGAFLFTITSTAPDGVRVSETISGGAISDVDSVFSKSYDNGGYISAVSGSAISDIEEDVSRDDNEDTVTLKGTIYYSLSHVGTTYHINPVYQSADGRVYVIDGMMGYMASDTDSEDFMWSQTFTETSNVTENGKNKNVTSSVEIAFAAMFEPKQIVISQMSDNNAVVSRDEYAPGKTPEELTPKAETAYIIAETHKTDGAGKEVVTREIFTELDTELYTFYLGNHGICEKAPTVLVWGG
jgi:hypothetical protein